MSEIVSLEEPPTGQHLIQHDAKGPDVRAFIHGLGARLLRRHVRRCSHNLPYDRGTHWYRWRLIRVAGHGCRFGHFCQAEIQHLHSAVGLDLDVGGLQVAMDNAFLMRGLERVADLPADRQRFLQRDCAFFDPVSQRWAFDQFHHQVVGAYIVHLADFGVIQRRNSVHLTLEAIAEAFGRDLDGDFAAHARIASTVDLAHATRAEGRQDRRGRGGCRKRRAYSPGCLV